MSTTTAARRKRTQATLAGRIESLKAEGWGAPLVRLARTLAEAKSEGAVLGALQVEAWRRSLRSAEMVAPKGYLSGDALAYAMGARYRVAAQMVMLNCPTFRRHGLWPAVCPFSARLIAGALVSLNFGSTDLHHLLPGASASCMDLEGWPESDATVSAAGAGLRPARA